MVFQGQIQARTPGRPRNRYRLGGGGGGTFHKGGGGGDPQIS